MKKFESKWLTMLFGIGLALTIFAWGNMALAVNIEDEAAKDEIKVIPSDANALLLMDAGAESPKGEPGDVVTIVLTMAVNREYLPSDRYLLRNITVKPAIPTNSEVGKWPFDLINASYVRHLDDMSYNATADVYYNFRISEFTKEGVYPVNFTVTATVWREDAVNGTSITEDVEFDLCVWLTVIGNGAFSGVTTDNGPIRMAETTAQGVIANPGQKITLPLALMNYGGAMTNLTIEPVVSASLDEFPFVAGKTSHISTFGSVPAKSALGVKYDFTVSPYATTGNKVITFKATYMENGKAGECTFTANIYIKNGYEDIPTTAPSLLISSYKLAVNGADVSGLMAGDKVTLTLTIKNNSAYNTAYKNVATLALPESKALAFTLGSSDSAYASSIAPGKTADFVYQLTVREDAEVGTADIIVTTTCETGDAVAGKAVQAIMLPVSQPMDLLVGEPVVYGLASREAPVAVGLNIVNMSRAKVLNLRVLAKDGLTMAENYFGGDLLAGGSLDADILVNCEKGGIFDGSLVITYEDANGESYSQIVSVPMSVPENSPQDPAQEEPESVKGGLTPWLLGTGAGLLLILLIFLLRKKSAKTVVTAVTDFFSGIGRK